MLKDHLILWKESFELYYVFNTVLLKTLCSKMFKFFSGICYKTVLYLKCWACCETLQYLCRVTEPFKILFVSGKKYISYKLSLLYLGCFKDIVDSLVGFPICPFQFKLGSYLNSMITSWKLFYSWTVLVNLLPKMLDRH